MNIYDRFEKHNDEFLKFERVENKRSSRADLCGFLFLEELFPDIDRDLICCAEHDQFWLDIDKDKIETLTDDQIIELLRCGILYDEENESLFCFT